MMTAIEAAQWMADSFLKNNWLDQSTAVTEIETRFGKTVVYVNDNGNMAINRTVLKEFNKLTRNVAIWSNSDKAWRRRMPTDSPNKRRSED